MKQITIALFVLILPGWAYGYGPLEEADTSILTSDSLPLTVATSNWIYILTGDISSATTGIDFGNSCDSVTLDLQGYDLTFGTGDGDDNYGIRFFGQGYPGDSHITVKNGGVVHGATDTTVDGNICFSFAGGNNILIQNVDESVLGYNAHIGKALGGSYHMFNVEIDGGQSNSLVHAYTSRCNYDGAAWDLNSNTIDSDTTTGFEFHWKIHGHHILNSPHAGFVVAGLMLIYEDTVNVNARNDLYTYPSGAVCWGSTNAACVSASPCEGGSRIYNNRLIAGDLYYGADEGVLLEMAQGATDNILVYGNYINIHRGIDAYYGNLNGKGIKIRYHAKNVKVYNNTVIVRVGEGAGTAYGPVGVGLEVVSYPFQGCDFVIGYGADTNVVWENNDVDVFAVDSSFDSGWAGPAGNVNGVRVAIRPMRWLGERYAGGSYLVDDSTVGTFTTSTYMAGGQIDSIRWYGYVASGTQTVCVSVYADNGSRTGPTGAALTSAQEEVSAASAAWHTFNVPDYSISYAQNYWVMVGSDEAGLYVYRGANAADTSFTVNSLCPDPWSGGAIQTGVEYSIAGIVTPADGWTWQGAGNVFRYNNLKSVGNIYKVAGFDASGRCDGFLAYGDTVSWYDLNDSTMASLTQRLVDIGYDERAIGNIIRDFVPQGRIVDSLDAGSAIRMWTSGVEGQRDISYERTSYFLVNGNNSLPVANASYWLRNAYGDTIATGTTGSDGRIEEIMRFRHEYRDLTDLTAFSPMWVKIVNQAATDSTEGTYEFDYARYDSTFVLANTEGSGPTPTRLKGIIP